MKKPFFRKITLSLIVIFILGTTFRVSGQCKADFNSSAPVVCGSGTVNFTNASSGLGLSYSWNFGDPKSGSNNISASKDASHLFSSPGVYSVKLIINTGSCTDSVKKSITVLEIPYLRGDTTVCAGVFTIQRPPISGYSYEWRDLFASGKLVATVANPTFTINNIGYRIYTVKASQNLNGVYCQTSDTFSIKVMKKPSARAGNSKFICIGDSIILGSTPDTGTIYTWKSVSGNFMSSLANPVVKPAVTTKYYLYAALKPAGSGCIFIDSVTITVFSDSKFKTSKLSDYTFRFTALDTNLTSYLWSFGDGITDTTLNPTHTYAKDSNYKVTLKVTNSNGCISFNDTLITVSRTSSLLASENKKPDIQIYPNPFSQSINLQYILTEKANINISIFDFTGREITRIINFTNEPGTYLQTIDASQHKMPAGVYFVKMLNNDTQVVKQIIKLQ